MGSQVPGGGGHRQTPNILLKADDSRTSDSGGAGLGLCLASAIVAPTVGPLHASHTDPSGLTITISLPNAEIQTP